jgi:hypothetical protein
MKACAGTTRARALGERTVNPTQRRSQKGFGPFLALGIFPFMWKAI